MLCPPMPAPILKCMFGEDDIQNSPPRHGGTINFLDSEKIFSPNGSNMLRVNIEPSLIIGKHEINTTQE